MDLEPDAKDWTWVLTRPCTECGFIASTFPRDRLGSAMVKMGPRWTFLLGREGVAQRVDPARWSVLEYGCHVRDVLVLYDERLSLMLGAEDAAFQNWDQDATAVEQRYDLQDPLEVTVQLVEAATQLGQHFSEVTADQWERTGHRSDGAIFTIQTFGQYLLHDLVHHLVDVGDLEGARSVQSTN
ncbi:MAG: DinB family protein [Actinomycetota bacterium]|jgi:hypothetical protein